ncbi:Type I transmembrane sorting receptor [Orbilia ellipsospora]|uniref:Type I transmembrane sorting receptor n=1 Tax=Orbilia ellipsospora TaxID=2528407 RepID=A0AAV9X0W7_9PEZI
MLNKLLLALVCTVDVLAAPAVAPESSQGFSIPVVYNDNAKRVPLNALYHAYLRYGRDVEIPEALQSYAKKLQIDSKNDNHKRQNSATVAATPASRDVEYWCPVQIGSNKLNLNFDTGSNALWVFSSVTPASERAGHNLYTPASSSLKKNGYTWSISYADGSTAAGVVYTDKVQIGSATVTNQAVQVATAVSGAFVTNTAIDGLLGLGYTRYNNISPIRSGTWFANAMSTLRSGVFTADLRPGAVGAYTFGFIDSSRYTGSITYQAVSSAAATKGWWLIDATKGYKIGTQQFTDPTGGSNGAVLDTGTTLLFMSDQVVKNYYSKVSNSQYVAAQGGWTYPCSVTLPDLYVPFGNSFAKIPGTYLKYATLDSAGTTCFGALQSLGTGNSGLPYIYGDIFFKANYAVFDMQNGRVGFATKSS